MEGDGGGDVRRDEGRAYRMALIDSEDDPTLIVRFGR